MTGCLTGRDLGLKHQNMPRGNEIAEVQQAHEKYAVLIQPSENKKEPT